MNFIRRLFVGVREERSSLFSLEQVMLTTTFPELLRIRLEAADSPAEAAAILLAWEEEQGDAE